MPIAASERQIFILPATVVVLGLSVFPLVFSLAMTFTNLRMAMPGGPHFIGLTNWARLFTDDHFHTTLRNTLIFALLGICAQYVLGFGLALILNQKIRARRFFRISLLLPMLMSPVAVSYTVARMLLDETFGPIDNLLTRLGFAAFHWALNPLKAMLVVVGADTWQWTPFFILVLLAGLQGIPGEIYEATRVDGASAWQIFLKITFPLMMPISLTAILIRLLEAFKVIDIIRVITGGGPGDATESVTLYAYDLGIKGGAIAYASTIAYALLIIVIVVATLLLLGGRRLTPTR